MNYGMIIYILGSLLKFEAVFMAVPFAVAIGYKEKMAGISFILVIAVCLLLGIAMTVKKPKSKALYAREGFVIVALSWIELSMVGALPFVFSGAIPSFVDALFETVSGFTTTGATILSEIESLPKSILFWRNFTIWLGGMGVLVLMMAVLPLSGGNNIYMMKAESTGPSVSKLVPRVKETAGILYYMYLVLSLVLFLLLVIGKMPVFEAVTVAFSTAGTGGFAVTNDSLARYSDYIQIIVTIFMVLFGVSFNCYYLLFSRKLKEAFRSSELWVYFGVILTAIIIVSHNIKGLTGGVFQTIKHAAFQVGSIITTTGFATMDFNAWPEMSKTILVLLMFIGACAGSTGGGIKIKRLLILFKSIRKELNVIVHHNNIRVIKIDGSPVAHEVVRSVNVFMVSYVFIFVVSLLMITLDGFDLVTNFTSIATTLNNIGPGLEITGPTGNFSAFSGFSKIVLIFNMLAGRLELFPFLILFSPNTWRK